MSVVIPTYNRADWLPGAVRSAFGQSVPLEEVVVVDDGSTDSTPEVCRELAGDIKYIRQENRGVSAARNRGALASTGRWIAFLDSDDRWHEEKLEIQVRALRRFEAVGWCITDAELVGADVEGTAFGRGFPLVREGRKHGREWFAEHLESKEISPPGSNGRTLEMFTGDMFPILLRGNVVQTSGLIVGRSLFFDVGGFDEELDVAEDMDLALRLAARPASCAVVPIPLYEWTMGDHESLTSPANTRSLIENALTSVKRARELRGRWGPEEERAFRAGRQGLWRRLAYLHLSECRLEKARDTLRSAFDEEVGPDVRMLAIWAASFLPVRIVEFGRALKRTVRRVA